MKLEIELPKGFMNVGIGVDNSLIADTNDSVAWDTVHIPLPEGLWSILNIEGKIVTLIKKECPTKKILGLEELSYKEKYTILNRTLINLHTSSWTGNHESFKKIMNAIGAYSYSQTNSTMDDEQDERMIRESLLALKEL